MALTKYRLGDLVLPFSQKCDIPNLTPYQVSGVNSNKEFFEPSRQVGEDTSNYKVVPDKHFACNLMHVGRDAVLPIAYNASGHDKYVSPAYTVFSLRENCGVLDYYFLLMLKSVEKDRYFWFHADGSVRDGMTWDDFSNIELSMPDLHIQQKYVNIYKAMLANQQSYERGLEDLKLTCNVYYDSAKKKDTIRLVEIIEKSEIRNVDSLYSEDDVKGITNNKEFSETKADLIGVDLSKFKIVQKNEFAYNSRTDGRDMLVLALNRGNTVIVTFNYGVFRIKEDKKDSIIPEYLYAYFLRSEFDRLVRFNSWGSSQELLSWVDLCDMQVPFPSIEEQKAIADLYTAYRKRKEINEKLKAQIKDLCPILIKGSIEEAQKEA